MATLQPFGGSFQSSTDTVTVFTAQSVLHLATADSSPVRVGMAGNCRVYISASGANITITLQASYDDGATWVTLDPAYTIGAVGAQHIVPLCDRLIRLHAANSHATDDTQTVSAVVLVQRSN